MASSSGDRPTRVVHKDDPECDVYVGRGSPWGNPFSTKASKYDVIECATVEEAINAYAEYLVTQPHLMARLPDLKGKALGCYCKTRERPDAPCHGDVLAALADGCEWIPLDPPSPPQMSLGV